MSIIDCLLLWTIASFMLGPVIGRFLKRRLG
jgi:hypothetical protein